MAVFCVQLLTVAWTGYGETTYLPNLHGLSYLPSLWQFALQICRHPHCGRIRPDLKDVYKRQGSITVGGMEVSQIDPEKLMSLYSIVFQDVTLFDNTILENIRLGRKGATDEEVLAAAKLANCEEFAEKLPDKWNTNIGENGCTLSGGERQRISIARAFLKDCLLYTSRCV